MKSITKQPFHCWELDKTVTHSDDCVNCKLYEDCQQRLGAIGLFRTMFFMLLIAAAFIVIIFSGL